jgi:predicted transcriptional regulator
MRQHKDLVFNDAGIGKPIDSRVKQINLPTPTLATDKRRDLTPTGTAAFLLKSRTIRSEQFRNIMTDIDDISWHILLDLMVATSSEKPVTAHDLAITHNVAMSTMARYVDYLVRVGLIVKNIDAGEETSASLQLTASGNALTSTALGRISRELANL